MTPPTMAPVFELFLDGWGVADAVNVVAPGLVDVAATAVGCAEFVVDVLDFVDAEDVGTAADVEAVGLFFCANPSSKK